MLLKFRKEKLIEKEENKEKGKLFQRLTKPKALIIMIIIAVIAIIGLIITSNGYTRGYANGIRWEFLIDGEDIVDLHMTWSSYNSMAEETKVEIPSEIDGKKVRKIGFQGDKAKNFLNNVEIIIETWKYGKTARQISPDYKVVEITVPDTVVEIQDYAFASLTKLRKINIPNSVERIGISAFENCKSLTEVVIPESVKNIDSNAFYMPGNQGSIEQIIVKSGDTIIEDNAFGCAKDVYIQCNKEEAEKEYVQNTGIVHYLDCKHTINTEVVEGIKVINEQTGEEIKLSEFDCGSDVTFHIEKEEGYEYKNLVVSIISDTDKDNKVVTDEGVNLEETIIDLEEGQSYTISDLKRNKLIVVRDLNNEGDLSLRQYISKVNGSKVEETRSPKVKIVKGRIEYRHTKYPLSVNTGDKVEYTLRVYNEGRTEGKATEITTYIPEGLEYISDNQINTENNWVYSPEENKVTTNKLSEEGIEPYENTFEPSYREIQLVLKVTKEREEEVNRLVTISEITGVGTEALGSNTGNIEGPVGSDYKYDLSTGSNSESYVKGQEKDDDFENVSVPGILTNQVRLKVEKIDGITNQYLDTAKFELLDEEKNSLDTQVTARGGVIDFGIIPVAAGERKVYYIKEIETPEGYDNSLSYIIKVTIENEIIDEAIGNAETKVKYDIEDIDLDTSKYEIIPIYTKEQFRKIGNGQEVEIEQEEKTYTFDNTKMYKLMNDIDLESEEWEPIKKVSGVMIDGGNYKIKNLSINLSESETKHVGLFGDFSGLIQNLTLENVNIQVQRTPPERDNPDLPISETDCVGAFAGYSENAFIRNCKVTGNIETNVKNVGGFIGHSAKENLIIFRKCTNEANVKGETNIGGLIGCSFTALEIIEGKNIGQIEATKYNAGGLVGCNLSEGYKVRNVDTRYDEKNSEVIVTVKNERTSGLYTLNLENVDIENLQLLDGSKFTIYGADKEVLEDKESVEVIGGKVQVATIDIDKLGTDTYYLRQIESPEGYEILSKEYYRLGVTKEWDSSTNKYKVKVTGKTVKDEEFEEDKVIDDTVTSQTGIEKEENDYIKAKQGINRVEIVKGINEGKVINNYNGSGGNSSGLVGKAQSDIYIDNSQNNGIITGQRAGGLISEALKQDEETKVDIVNSQNNGTVNQSGSASWIEIAGIIAISYPDTYIYNSKNTGTINSIDCSAAGIVASLAYTRNTKIVLCKNEGDIIRKNTGYVGTGGIVGHAGKITGKSGWSYGVTKEYDDSKLEISDCTNIGNINNGSHTGGILGGAYLYKEYKISNCNTFDCTIISNDNGNAGISGIVGYDKSETANIENCNVTNCDIIHNGRVNSTNGVGGILGIKSIYDDYYGNEITSSNININNCHVIESNLVGKCCLGGIVGINNTYSNYKIDCTDITIKNCSVEGAKNEDGSKGEPLTIRSNDGYVCNVAGIIANVTNSSGGSGSDIIIEGCTVYNADLISSPINFNNTNDINVSGIVGELYSNIDSLQVLDCNINEVNIQLKDENKNAGYNNAAGVIGYVGPWNAKLCDIERVNISNSKINTMTGNASGIMCVNDGTNHTELQDCLLENVVVERKTGNSSSNSLTAGVIAYNSTTSLSIENCDIKNSELKNEGWGVSGIVTWVRSNYTISECDIEDTKFKYNSMNESASITGGSVAGISGFGSGSGSIENCNVRDCSFTAERGGVIGGIQSTTYGNENIINCNVTGTSIIRRKSPLDKNNGQYYNSACGGILGENYSSYKVNITDCTAIDLTMNINGTSTGGICGSLENNESIISGCKVEDSNIISGSTNNIGSYGSVGGIIGDGKGQVTDCKLINTDIETKSDNIGGIIGYYNGEKSIDNNIVEDVSLYHTGEVTPYFISSGSSSSTYYRSIGGIIGNASKASDSFIVTNPIINKLDITVAGGNSGYVSTGGVIGLVGGATTPATGAKTEVTGATINDLNIENYSTGGNAGGLIGMTTYKPVSGEVSVSINGLTMDEVGIITNGHIGGVIGFVPGGKLEVKSQTKGISNIDLNYPIGSNNSGQCIGGVVGITGGTIDIDIPISGVTASSKLHVGGILGIGAGGKISNTIKDINITQEGYIGGGLVGILDKTSNGTETAESLIVNSDIDNVKVTSKGGFSGGLVGIAKIYFEYNGNASNITVTNNSTNGSANASGVAGIVGLMDEYNQNGDAIINGTLTNCNVTTNGYASAVVGFGKVKTEGFTVTGANIVNKNSNTSSNCNNVAGIFAGLLYPGSEIRNVNIYDSEVTSADRVGGVIGLVGSGRETGTVIDQCNVSNVKIKSTAKIPSSVGGIVGHIGNTTDTITNCSVTNNSSITATGGSNISYGQTGLIGGITGFSNGVIEGCNVSDTSISTIVQDVGGIVGTQGATTGEVNNCTVERVTITNTQGRTGGIAGFTNSTIDNCHVIDSNLTGLGSIGGLVGHGSNYTTTLTYITGSTVEGTKITGTDSVGGIIGTAGATIENCEVKSSENTNTEITGTNNVGGIMGESGMIGQDTQQGASISGTTIKDAIITGTTNVQYIIGKLLEFTSSYTGSQVDTISEDSIQTNCTLNVE